MAHSFETVVTGGGRDFFLEAAARYLEQLGFEHHSVGGAMGGRISHEFSRSDYVVTIDVSEKGQEWYAITVSSDTTPVEHIVLDLATEGAADFLEPFCDDLPAGDSRRRLAAAIKHLRDAFVYTKDDIG